MEAGLVLQHSGIGEQPDLLPLQAVRANLTWARQVLKLASGVGSLISWRSKPGSGLPSSWWSIRFCTRLLLLRLRNTSSPAALMSLTAGITLVKCPTTAHTLTILSGATVLTDFNLNISLLQLFGHGLQGKHITWIKSMFCWTDLSTCKATWFNLLVAQQYGSTRTAIMAYYHCGHFAASCCPSLPSPPSDHLSYHQSTISWSHIGVIDCTIACLIQKTQASG